ncbi:MarR family transcriptional regulator [Lachnospiraceae bacterium 46-61]
MKETLNVVNTLLVDTFRNILTIEQNALKKENFFDVSVAEVHTIEAIGMYQTKSMSEVAKSLQITVGTLTVAINNLVKKEYVERFRCQSDKRVVLIKLTKKGKLLYRIHEQFHKNVVKAIISGLTKQEREVLCKTLRKLNVYLQKYF